MTAKSFFARLQAIVRRERAEARDLVEDTTARWESTLDRKERELAEDPVTRFQRAERDILDSDPFEAVRARIERTDSIAEAVSEIESPSPHIDDSTGPDPN